jgi:hypothetical protein
MEERKAHCLCVLRREDKEIETWVPGELAKQYNVLKLKRGHHASWESGWVVHTQKYAWASSGGSDGYEFKLEEKSPAGLKLERKR